MSAQPLLQYDVRENAIIFWAVPSLCNSLWVALANMTTDAKRRCEQQLESRLGAMPQEALILFGSFEEILLCDRLHRRWIFEHSHT